LKKKEFSSIKQENQKLKTDLEVVNNTNKTNEQSILSLRQEIEKFKNDITVKDTEINKLKEKKDKGEKKDHHSKELKKEIDRLKNELEILKVENSKLNQDKEKTQNELIGKDKKI